MSHDNSKGSSNITFEDHPRIKGRVVVRSNGGGHLANIVPRNMGGSKIYTVEPYCRWIGNQTFNTMDAAVNYVKSMVRN